MQKHNGSVQESCRALHSLFQYSCSTGKRAFKCLNTSSCEPQYQYYFCEICYCKSRAGQGTFVRNLLPQSLLLFLWWDTSAFNVLTLSYITVILETLRKQWKQASWIDLLWGLKHAPIQNRYAVLAGILDFHSPLADLTSAIRLCTWKQHMVKQQQGGFLPSESVSSQLGKVLELRLMLSFCSHEGKCVNSSF